MPAVVRSVRSGTVARLFVMSATSEGGRWMPRMRRGRIDEATNRRLLSLITYQNGSSAVSTAEGTEAG